VGCPEIFLKNYKITLLGKTCEEGLDDLYLYFNLFQIPSDPYKGISSHTTGYGKRHFSLQNVPLTKEQVNGHSLYIHTYIQINVGSLDKNTQETG
jgi:hypothetical protein